MKKLVIFAFIVVLSSCRNKPEGEDSVIKESITDHPTEEVTTPEEYCFLKVNGKDTIKLNFEKKGDSIWGNYNNMHYGIDKRISTFKGTLNGKEAHTISKYSAEGQDYTEELVFTLSNNEARLNYGPTEQGENGIWHYKKGAPLQAHILPKVPCD